MATSNKLGKILLATGNKSEMAVGYATLYGDMCGGFAPLKDIPKTMVYELAKYRNSNGHVIPQNVIDRAPSAELSPDQIDEDSLPPYSILDHARRPSLIAIVNNQTYAHIIGLSTAEYFVQRRHAYSLLLADAFALLDLVCF